MPTTKNILLPTPANKPIPLDIFYKENAAQLPVVIYAHGFNGFKDWGNFDIIARRFAEAGFVLVKFNFSHNGTSPEHPEEFVDLEAFGNNNYTKQLEDLQRVIDWVCDMKNPHSEAMDTNDIYLIGHSMGGGIAILQAARDARVKKLITWAAISECKTPWGSWSNEKMEAWRQSGVQYSRNGRTKQNMPLYYQLYEDYLQHEDELNIEKAMKGLNIPVLICHGSLDAAVPVEKARLLKEWQPRAELFIVESDHVFGRKHPWEEEGLPAAMEEVVRESIWFLC
jgi:acetyl esterase/lipase